VKEVRIEVVRTEKTPDYSGIGWLYAQKLREISNPDGTFTDPALEAEYQQWKKEKGGN
jgi:hypothetical protein